MYYKKVRHNFTSYNIIFTGLEKMPQNPKLFQNFEKIFRVLIVW